MQLMRRTMTQTTRSDLAVIVLAAGKGKRMRSDRPKVMHRLAGQTMLRHVLSACEALSPDRIIVVAGPAMPEVEAEASPHAVVTQPSQAGTGDAVRVSLPAIGEVRDVLVVYGDTPLIRSETLGRMVAERRETGAAAVVLGMNVPPPNDYGRLMLDRDGGLAAIVEAREATPEQLANPLCNSGVIAISGAVAADLVRRLTPSAGNGEYYLTDIVALARADGATARVIEAPAEELAGVNSRADLAAAEAILQRRLREAALAGGATLVDPPSVFLAADTKLGRDVVIGPHVVFGPGVTVEDGAEIKAFCHLEGAVVRGGAIVGPFARLRPGAEIGETAHVGNFVELKNARLGRGAKVNHLTYLGDTEVGARTNVGAGTITCNYDGFGKFRTVIGADVFIGSNAALVAPVTVGEGAMIAAGSVITRDVAPDATAIARGVQVDKPGHAARFRAARRRGGV